MKTASQKKGFTLIELMVVIVIIGILAAIAIPKLFGMSAKAKAQEVGPAIGTWAKMQQAYKMEVGKYSSYDTIGYKVPGAPATPDGTGSTGNFNYDLTTNDSAYVATSKFASDPCAQGATWSATFVNITTDDPSVGIVNTNGGTGAKDADCKTLTPQFCNIGSVGNGTGACAPAGP